ncbi:GNAT family N-acetyltransferase [Flavobacterium sp. H122]|uniref:GNAT family N-acetyltransferase n=1 Tax=Flavobacterium sp. H122 TaxID=2529860 RepID=UPI0010AAA97C|nr:GNAT family N-acetyltransferase [Flavobacterium sp. H122]
MNVILETERLILRPIEMNDAESLFLLESNPNVHKYLGNHPVKSLEESTAYIVSLQNQYKNNGIGRFAVILKESGEFIGWSGIKFITEEENKHINFYEIGYRLREEYWGKGFAYEAAKAWYDYAINELKVDTLYASAHIDNAGSRRILEKIGLKLKNEFIWNKEVPSVWYASN